VAVPVGMCGRVSSRGGDRGAAGRTAAPAGPVG